MSLAALDRSAIDLQRFQPAWLDTPAANPAGEAQEPPLQPLMSGRSFEEIFGPPSPLLLAKAVPPSGGKAPPAPPPGVKAGTVPDPAAGNWFVGVKLGAQDQKFMIPWINRKLDLNGFGPALAVYFPEAKTAFITSTGSVAAPLVGNGISKGASALGLDPALGRLKYVATYNHEMNTWQLGIGNSVMHQGYGYFYNARVSPDGLAAATAKSLKSQGKDIPVGTLNFGVIQSPRCDEKTTSPILNSRGQRTGTTMEPGVFSRAATGVGLQAQLVARDGQLGVKFGRFDNVMPLAIFEGATAAASSLLSNSDNIACKAKQTVSESATAIHQALASRLKPDQIVTFGAGAAGLVWAIMQAVGSGELRHGL
jgi:hypothetical protein